MNNLIKFFPENYCINCEKEDTILLITPTKVRVPLKSITPFILDTKTFDCMECSSCNQKYIIDWSAADRIPKPIYKINKED